MAALLYEDTQVFYSDHPLAPPPYNQAGHYETHPTLVSSSDWSSTQTVTIPAAPSQSPALMASISESASALNLGNKVNFTVTIEGGKAPYTYAWYLDGQLAETSIFPYYALDSAASGSHDVYAEVIDSNGNSAKTLTVEFNVLPNPSATASPSGSAQLESTTTPNQSQDNDSSIGVAVGLVLAAVVACLLVYLARRRGAK